MLEECGTVKCAEALVSGFLKEVAANEAERSSGSLGVGLKRSGCAIWASSVSYGKNEALGRPADGN
jgi:hypothetical protein